MRLRFLLDENLSPRLALALRRALPSLDVLWVGSPGVPPMGILDPVLLAFLEESERVLVTDNRRTIPGHAAAHLAAGGHHPGILFTRPGASLRALVETLVLIWETGEAGDLVDQQLWIPF